MSVAAFRPGLYDIFDVELKGPEAVFKYQSASIPTAMNYFIQLYQKENDFLTDEDKINFKAKFQALFSRYLTPEQEGKIFNIIKPTAPVIKKEPEIRREPLSKETLIFLEKQRGFINVTEADAGDLQELIGKDHYFICLDAKNKCDFKIYTPTKIFDGIVRKNEFVIVGRPYPTLEQFQKEMMAKMEPLEVERNHPTWEKLPYFYDGFEGDFTKNEPTVPLKMPPCHYSICRSLIPGCITLATTGVKAEFLEPCLIIPKTNGKFMMSGVDYDSIEEIAVLLGYYDDRFFIPFDVQKALKEKPVQAFSGQSFKL
jgi:hypothetical protein